MKTPVALLRASPRCTAWWLLTQPAEARAYLEPLCQRSPEIASCAATAREFMRMVRERDFAAWPRWLETAKTTLLSRLATHLARDQDAVLAALTLPWSNGPVEGQLHRLKLINAPCTGEPTSICCGALHSCATLIPPLVQKIGHATTWLNLLGGGR